MSKIDVYYKKNLAIVECNKILDELRDPQVALWYIGVYGFQDNARKYFRDHFLSKHLSKSDIRFWLVDLTAWYSFKSSKGSIKKSSKFKGVLEEFSVYNRIKYLSASSIFDSIVEIECDKIRKYFKKILTRSCLYSKSIGFKESGITLGEIFSENAPILKDYYDEDCQKFYSVLQYLEGLVICKKILYGVKEEFSGKPVNIVFLLPNDENEYYKDLKEFKKDLLFYLSQDEKLLSLIKQMGVSIYFLSYEFDEQLGCRPYNIPGRRVNRGKLKYEDIIGK